MITAAALGYWAGVGVSSTRPTLDDLPDDVQAFAAHYDDQAARDHRDIMFFAARRMQEISHARNDPE